MFIFSFFDSGSLLGRSWVLRCCVSYHHLAWCVDVSLGGGQHPIQLGLFYVPFLLHWFRFTFRSSLVLEYYVSYHYVAWCVNASLGICQHPNLIRSLWPTFYASLTQFHFNVPGYHHESDEFAKDSDCYFHNIQTFITKST